MSLILTGTLETGQVNASGSAVDGFLIQTLNGTAYVSLTTGGAGPSSGYDTRVVASETYNGDAITPRNGSYFIRSEIFYTKDYSVMPFNSGTNKPRSSISASNTALRRPFDAETYIGFSIRLPTSFWHETGVRDDRGSIQLLTCYPGTDTNATFFSLQIYVKSPSTTANWYLWIHTDATSISESSGAKVEYDLGPVSPDIGLWTDFIIRYRANPFSTATNPSLTISGSKNQVYSANQGIFQVWKGTGTADSLGNRTMSQVGPNIVGAPVGLVPKATDELQHSWRIYKYGWHNNSTASTNPVWIGFDDMKIGTTYADVAPENASISLVNLGNAIPANQNPMYLSFSGVATSAERFVVTSSTITDGNSLSEEVLAINGHYDGARAIVGPLTGMLGGSATISVDYNIADVVLDSELSSEKMSTWSVNTAATVADASGTYPPSSAFGCNFPVLISNITVGVNGYIISPDFPVTAGQTITVRLMFKAGQGSTARVYIRNTTAATNTIYYGTFSGTWATTGTPAATPGTTPVSYVDGNSIDHVVITDTANASGNFLIRIGSNSTASGDKVYALYCSVTVDEVPVTLTADTTLDIADATPPSVDCDLISIGDNQYRITATLSESATVKYVVQTDFTEPSKAQIAAGQDSTGGAAKHSGSSLVSGLSYSSDFSGLDPYTDSYLFMYAVDAADNESDVVLADSYIAAIPSVTKSIKFDATNGYLKRGGALFTGTFDNFKLYDKDPLRYGQYHATDNPNGASLLAHAASVSVTSGVLTLTESDLTSGSINGLEAATDYWFYIFDNDKDPFAFGEIQITVE